MSIAKSIKDYTEKIWPEVISICCSIIIFILSQGCSNILLAITLIISPFILAFPIRHFFRVKKNFFDETPNHLMVSSIKLLRECEKEFPQDNTDGDKFAQTMVNVCDSVCQTIIGKDREINKCNEYSVVVCLGVSQTSGVHEGFSPLYSDNSKMSETYMKEYGAHIFSLKENTLFKEVYTAYRENSPHTPKIIAVSNVKKKIHKGHFHSSLLTEGVGVNKFPYNSSCVFPILPFHNHRKGDEMQGYVYIMSKKNYAFKDSGIANKDFSNYLESVSGILYSICIKDKSKDKTPQN